MRGSPPRALTTWDASTPRSLGDKSDDALARVCVRGRRGPELLSAHFGFADGVVAGADDFGAAGGALTFGGSAASRA